MLRTLHLKKPTAFPLIVTCTLLFSLAVTTLVGNTVPLKVHAANHATCESPPAGFDPTASSVTNATLAKYGYPLRPSSSTSSSSYQWWLKIVKNVQHHVCTTSTSTTTGSIHAKASRQSQTMMPLTFNATKYYDGFAGYIGYSSSLSIFTGTWVVPCPHSGGSVSDGIMLLSSSNSWILSVGTTETHDTSSNTDTDQFVMQAGSEAATIADATSYPIKCGDSASATIEYDATDPLGATSGPVWYGWVFDNATHTSFNISVSASGGASAGSEFCGESGRYFSVPSSTNPLLKFNPIAWSGVTIDPGTGNGTTISNYSPTIGQMNNASGSGLAYPGNLDSTGAGFTDTWYNAY